MSPAVERLRNRIDALSLRERGMLVAILLLLVWGIWHSLLMGPVSQRQALLAQRLDDAHQQLTTFNASIQQLAVERGRDPLAEQRARLELLQRERARLDTALADATTALIDPRDMGPLLESLLARHPGVELQSLRSLPREPLPSQATGALPPVYRHGVELEVEGSYQDLLRLLQSLEASHWQFVWDELALEVQQHPRSRLRIRLYTLSLREGWFGV